MSDEPVKTEPKEAPHGAEGLKGLPDNKAAEAKPADSGGKPIMHVKVHSPFKIYFDGDALSISAESKTGPFDILPKHHNFITLLVPCEVTVRTASGDQTFTIGGGIMHVKADDVVVFLDV